LFGGPVTRRDFLRTPAAAVVPASPPERLRLPLHRVVDARADCPAEQRRLFWSNVWPEAVRTFSRGGIDLDVGDGPGEVRRSPGDRPVFVGLRRGVLNLVVTGHIPMHWDHGRALAGVTTAYHGYHICMVAMRYAYGHRVPFFSVNSCVHEILHALLQDIFDTRSKWYQAGGRELRIDWYATRLWLFREGSAIRNSARQYLDRLRRSQAGEADAGANAAKIGAPPGGNASPTSANGRTRRRALTLVERVAAGIARPDC
jgi:hypothetical protein